MPMYSACGNAALPALGFPIRESADHRLFSAYPRLIAAVHALHRLQVPRHPPCALLILTVITHSDSASKRAVIPVSLAKLCSFQGPCKSWRRRDSPSVSQNSTACEAPSSYPPTCVGGHRRTARLRPGSVDIARTCRLIQPRCATARPEQALQSWRLP
jgi:hypothetical protein